MRRSDGSDIRLQEFVNDSRITVLACICGEVETAPPLFVFKGQRPPYRNAIVNVPIEASYLPKDALVVMRNEVGGVDSANFDNWAHRLFDHVRYLT